MQLIKYFWHLLKGCMWFVLHNKLWWIVPIIALLLLLALLIVLGQPTAPCVYTLF